MNQTIEGYNVSDQERRERVRKEYGMTPYSKGAELDPHRHDDWIKKVTNNTRIKCEEESEK